MLKVFLVEDECVVREGLRECIDWARYGFEFCGDAPDWRCRRSASCARTS